MEYIKVFATEQERESALTQIEHRTLSVVRGTKSLQVMPGVPPAPAPDYVEIGGIKWALKNVGASTIYDAGLYFAWGETQGYTLEQVVNRERLFTEAQYKLGNGVSNLKVSDLRKYNNGDNKTSLELTDDAAHVNMGGNWRMPTSDEVDALCNAADHTWTEDYNNSGVAGMIFTDKTDSNKVLFFPVSGLLTGNTQLSPNYGFLWTKSLYTSDKLYAYNIILRSEINPGAGYNKRWYGMVVRGILDE